MFYVELLANVFGVIAGIGFVFTGVRDILKKRKERRDARQNQDDFDEQG